MAGSARVPYGDQMTNRRDLIVVAAVAAALGICAGAGGMALLRPAPSAELARADYELSTASAAEATGPAAQTDMVHHRDVPTLDQARLAEMKAQTLEMKRARCAAETNAHRMQDNDCAQVEIEAISGAR